MYFSLFNGYDDITEILLKNKNLDEAVKTETMKLLQQGGGGDKSTKLLKMVMGEIFGEKVEKANE